MEKDGPNCCHQPEGAGANAICCFPPEGANIDQALILTAELGHVNCVETLMALGADVNSRDVDGETALIRSSGNGLV